MADCSSSSTSLLSMHRSWLGMVFLLHLQISEPLHSPHSRNISRTLRWRWWEAEIGFPEELLRGFCSWLQLARFCFRWSPALRFFWITMERTWIHRWSIKAANAAMLLMRYRSCLFPLWCDVNQANLYLITIQTPSTLHFLSIAYETYQLLCLIPWYAHALILFIHLPLHYKPLLAPLLILISPLACYKICMFTCYSSINIQPPTTSHMFIFHSGFWYGCMSAGTERAGFPSAGTGASVLPKIIELSQCHVRISLYRLSLWSSQ